jgi:endoglucanase
MYGHLTGGPDWNDDYQNEAVAERELSGTAQLECALNYMTGFVGNLARMAQEFDGAIAEDFPPPEQRAESPSIVDDQYFVEAKLKSSGSNHVEIQAYLNNRSNLPARRSDKFAFRYYFTLEDGVSPGDISVEVTGKNEGAVISGPTHAFEDVYYLTVDFDGVMILPFTWWESGVGFHREYRKEVNFRINSAEIWDTENDWSFQDLSSELLERMRMPVYENGEYLFGLEPPEPTAANLRSKTAAVMGHGTNRVSPVVFYNLQGRVIETMTNESGRNAKTPRGSGIYLSKRGRRVRIHPGDR